MRRNLIIIFIVLLAAAAGFIYLTKDKSVFSKETSLYKAVPVSAPIFLELSALKSIPTNNPMIEGLLAMEKDILFFKTIVLMDTLIQNNKEIQNSLRNEAMVLAFDFVGENKIFPLIVIKSASSSKQKSIEKFLSFAYPAGKFSIQQKKYSNRDIITVNNVAGEGKMFYCFSDGLFLASPKELLLEKAIRQMSTQSVIDNSFFAQVNKTVSSQAKISWYINHQTFPDLVALWLNKRSSISTNEFGENIRTNFSTAFKGFKNFAAWSELDIKLSEDEIAFTGISAADDSLNHFLSVFDGQEPVRIQSDKILPKNTSFFTSYSFSNKTSFFDKLEKYFSHTQSYYKREDQIKKLNRACALILKVLLKEWPETN